MRNFFKLTTIPLIYSGLLLSTSINYSMAAVVPEGVVLSDKQTLIRNNSAEPRSLDIHKVEGIFETAILRDLLESLTISDPDGKIVGGAAESWEQKDFKVWTFHLRKNAKWSNGNPVTANDFVYAWQRLVDPKVASPHANYIEYGKVKNAHQIIKGELLPSELGVKAIDDYTLEITLDEPVPFLDQVVAQVFLAPVHKKTIEAFGDKWTMPNNFVGNGAYTLSEWVVNSKIVLKRNPQYWDNEHTVINEVTFLPITSESTSMQFYRSGNIDMGAVIPLEQWDKFKQEQPEDIITYPKLCVFYFEFNTKQAPFNDIRVRQALKLGLDIDVIATKVVKPSQIAAYSLTPASVSTLNLTAAEWTKLDNYSRYQRAKTLLKEAGYDENHPLEFTLTYNTADNNKLIAVAASSMWKKNLGVNAKLNNLEWKTYLASRHSGDYQVMRAAWCGDYDEPSTFLNIMRSNSANNTAFYNNPEYDKLMDAALIGETPDIRANIYGEIEQILDRDTPLIPVYHYVTTMVRKPYVGGFTGKDLLDNFKTKDLYIIKH